MVENPFSSSKWTSFIFVFELLVQNSLFVSGTNHSKAKKTSFGCKSNRTLFRDLSTLGAGQIKGEIPKLGRFIRRLTTFKVFIARSI